MSNFNSCISEPPQPIPSYFMGVSASFSHSYFFIPSEYFFLYMYFFFFYIFFVGNLKMGNNKTNN
jgi:hypothetical protein